MNLIYDNGFVYVNDKKIKYKINSILSNVLVKDKEKYNLERWIILVSNYSIDLFTITKEMNLKELKLMMISIPNKNGPTM